MAFDAKPARAKRVQPSGTKPDDPIRVVAISGVSDPDMVQQIARGIYEETARQELEGSFETSDPSSFGVDFADANLLDLRAGQPLRIEIDARDQGEVADSVTLLQGMSIPARVRRLEEAGFRPKVARAYALLLETSNLQTVFCVQNVSIDFDRDSGLKLQVDFQNYITIREDLTQTIAADPAKQATARTKGQKGPSAQALRDQSQKRKLAEKTAAETNVPPKTITIQQYEAMQREGINADYADEILAEPQTKF
jgi:hypothetical protein